MGLQLHSNEREATRCSCSYTAPPAITRSGTSSGFGPPSQNTHTVYAIDRRGRGGSGDAPEYELEREFEDVAAIVESIDEPVNLLGHSYGALCSLEAALHTDNLRTRILYEPPIPVGDHDVHDENVLAEMTALVNDGEDEQALVMFLRKVAGLSPAELGALRAAPNWQNRVSRPPRGTIACRIHVRCGPIRSADGSDPAVGRERECAVSQGCDGRA